MLSEEFATGLSAISLIGLYIVGGTLRKSSSKFVHWSKWNDLCAFFICTFIMTGASMLLLSLGVKKSIFGYLNPIIILEAIFLFQFFRKIHIGRISWINYLAAGAFSAFLFHCHPLISGSYYKICKLIDTNFDFSALFVIIAIAIIYLFAVLIDKIRACLYLTLCEVLEQIKMRFYHL